MRPHPFRAAVGLIGSRDGRVVVGVPLAECDVCGHPRSEHPGVFRFMWLKLKAALS